MRECKWDIYLLIYCLLIVFVTERLTTAFHTREVVDPHKVFTPTLRTTPITGHLNPDETAPSTLIFSHD